MTDHPSRPLAGHSAPSSGAAPRRDADDRFEAVVHSIEDYAVFLLDRNGFVTSWNRGAARIEGYEAEDIIGQHFSRFYTREAVARNWPTYELEQATLTGRFEDEGWRVRQDGTTFWANVVITAIRNRRGELTGFAKIVRDLTDRRRQMDALQQSEERLRLLIESVNDHAIFMLDPTGQVVSWNSGATNIHGYLPTEIIGRHFSTFYVPEEIAADKPRRNLETAKRRGRFVDEGWRMRKDGSMFWANVTLTAVYDADRRLTGFAKITRDMTESRQRDELERSGQRMRDFLATLAHELRNPLAPVRNAISSMQIERDVPAGVARSRDLIDRQIAHLSRLVDDLLDVGRITSGKIELRQASVNLGDVIGNAIEAARPFTARRGQTVDVHLPADPVLLRGDMARLVQVFQNLLHNAAKFSPTDSRIAINVEVEERTVEIRIRDLGRGIRREALESIFDLFTQERTGQDALDEGLGIGLTLCRSLVELHGGTISAMSHGRGTGSTFIVRLPLGLREPEEAPPPPVDAVPDAHLRVLVVDDNRDSADSLAMLLELKGHDVRVAYDGAAALDQAERFVPHVALIDIAMPKMDGYAALRVLRKRPELADTYFAAMTGFGQQSDIALSREAGFDVHLIKPVDPQLFDELLSQAAKRQAARQAARQQRPPRR
ncbi:PAS domain S-box protein [Paraburkholderia kururiensis]|uniref:PAS domain-containing hybrid sensor histidine kinase/response regulator n=1 Tax=Paraburkholderia kururiensis TaxID=984307 RepID=UPI0009DF1904